MRRVFGVLCSLALILSACGDDDDQPTTAGDEPTTTADTTTSSSAPQASVPGDPTELPGEVIDIYPYLDDQLAVVGVEADDTLNIRSGPSIDFEIVGNLGPLDQSSRATGTNRTVGESFWVELTVDGTTGWVNGAFVLQPGDITDVTTEFYPTPADLPGAETLVDLADIVADEVRSEDPLSTVTIVDGPTVGDLGEITIDVVGLGDDALGGLRLHIFAVEDEAGESFSVKSIEQTLLCSRGVSEGSCT